MSGVVREVKSIRLADGTRIDERQVIPADANEKFYVVALMEANDGMATATCLLLRNLGNGELTFQDVTYFQNLREDGFYLL